MSTNLAIYCTQTVQPQFFPYWHSGPISPHFITQWAYTPSFTYTVGTTRAMYCTQTVQPQFLPYLHSGPIPPHFMTEWAYTLILFLTQWAPPSKSAVHTLSSLISLCPLCKKMGGIGPLCQKMRRYGTTVQVREKMKLDSLCTVDGFGGAPCISKWGYRPTVA